MNTYELCPYCEHEVELKNVKKKVFTICPHCKKNILPCSLCTEKDMLSCSKCNIIEVRYHSNSKEYTLHISADGGAIFFTKSKNTMKKHLLKYFNYDLKDEEIKFIQH